MTVYSYPQLVQFANNAGFSGDSANTAAAIAMAESSGDSTQINTQDPGNSYGLLQINGAAWGQSEAQASLDPQTAFNNAYSISGSGTNFTPWSTYNSGAYSKYLASGGIVSGGANPNISYSGTGDGTTGLTGSDPGYGGGSVNAPGSGAASGTGAAPYSLLNDLGNSLYNDTVAPFVAPGSSAATTGTGFFASILNDVWNIVERGGLILIGIVLVGIAAYVISKPHVGSTVKAIGKAIPATI